MINGSPEHLEALRTTLSHHEGRRDALRMKHGNDFDEFENVRAELDHLESELHMLTDHAVSLDANFSKYGYRFVLDFFLNLTEKWDRFPSSSASSR